MFSSVSSFVWPVLTNSHVLSAFAGAITTWAVGRFSTFMGWYAKNEAAISKATGVHLPPALPTTVAEMKAAAAPVSGIPMPTALSIPTDVEKALMAWKGDIVADVKKVV